MRFLRDFLRQFLILSSWPILSFLLLQIAFVMLWDHPCAWHLSAALLVSTIIFGLFFYKRQFVQVGVLFGLVGISFFLHKIHENPLSRNITSKAATYSAVIEEENGFQEGLSRFVVTLLERVEPATDSVSGRVQLTVPENCDWSKGSYIVFVGAIKNLDGYRNPGSFLYEDYLRRKNIWGTTFLENCAAATIKNAKPRTGFAKLRADLLQNIRSPQIENPDILGALLLGSNSIDQDKNEKIRMAGLSHLFVISGLQFAIMAAIVFFLLRRCFNFFPKLFLRVPAQKLTSGVTLGFVIFYMLLINHHPSVVRAGLTIAFYLVAILFEKQKQLLHVVLLSMAVSLFFYPMDLFHAGFQMSYLCVLTLVLVAPKQWRWIESHRFFANLSARSLWCIKAVSTTWLLNLMLLPLVLHEFGQISLNGLIQNLWAIPYFEFLVTPVGLLYLVTALLSLNMAPYILVFWDGTLKLFWLLFDYFSALSLPEITLFALHPLHLWIFYVGLFLYFYTARRQILMVTLCGLLASLGLTYYQTHLGFDFRITQIDVGQGDAVLVQTPAKNYLIDTGGHPFRDVGKLVLSPTLRHMWVNRIDVVILTHGDADHYKGLFGLIDRIAIGEVWVNDLPPDDPAYAELLTLLSTKKIPIVAKTAPEQLPQKDGTQIEILSPNPKTVGLANKNDHSIVLKMQKDGFSALFTGDISQEAEKILVELYGDKLKSDFLKVAHHGSTTSTSQLFLGYVQPRFASIGVKRDSQFGHPTPEVLDKLQEYKSEILRTDQSGQIQLSLTGDDIKIRKFVE